MLVQRRLHSVFFFLKFSYWLDRTLICSAKSKRHCQNGIVKTALSKRHCQNGIVKTALSKRHCQNGIVKTALSKRHCQNDSRDKESDARSALAEEFCKKTKELVIKDVFIVHRGVR